MKTRSHLRMVTGAICLLLGLTAATVDAQQPMSVQIETTSASSDQHPCVVVMGAVPFATRVKMLRPLRLMEALFLAGGLTEGAAEVVKVAHSSSEITCAQIPAANWEPTEQQTKSYSIAALKRDEESANPYLLPGDIVHVERLPSVGVIGCVAAGRWFYIREPITLTRAVAMAGGPTKKAARVVILRQNPPAPEWPIIVQADLELITKGRAKDTLLQDGDTVQVLRRGGDMCGAHIFW